MPVIQETKVQIGSRAISITTEVHPSRKNLPLDPAGVCGARWLVVDDTNSARVKFVVDDVPEVFNNNLQGEQLNNPKIMLERTRLHGRVKQKYGWQEQPLNEKPHKVSA